MHAADARRHQDLQRITSLISAQSDEYSSFTNSQLSENNVKWQQALCSHLLFVFEPQRSLSDVVKHFTNNSRCLNLTRVGNSGEEDLLFALLRIYAGDGEGDHAAAKLRSFHDIRVSQDAS